MRAAWIGMVVVLGVGCSRVQEVQQDQFDALGIVSFQAANDEGSVSYDGRAVTEQFDVTTTLWGTGSSKARATEHQNGATARIGLEGDALVVEGFSARRAGVDFDVVGPGVIDTHFSMVDGRAELRSVEGYHYMEAQSIYGRAIVGEGDFYAYGGDVDLSIEPWYDGALIHIESDGGDVRVGLPYGYDYDLTVETDVDMELAIEELGFDNLILEPGLAIGRRGFRDVRVDIFARNGNVHVYGI